MISVCIATFNGEKYIKEQLDSILRQIGSNDEVIISDDASTDTTKEIIKNFNDDRIKLYNNNLGKGYSKNFENAILNSKGDIIFISDQDDVWKEKKLEKMLKELENFYLVVSDAEITDANLNTINNSHFKLRKVKKGFLINFLMTRYIGACMAFRREILLKALPFPKNQKLCAYDYWLTLVAEFYFNVVLLEESLLKYRRHGGNVSTGGDKSKNPFTKRLITRGYSLIMLLSRYWR